MSYFMCNFKQQPLTIMRQPTNDSYKIENTNLKKLHFAEAVYRLRKKKEYAKYDLKSACVAACNQGAPQYYVTAKHALERYSQWKRLGDIENVSECDRRKFMEIFEKYEAERIKMPRENQKFSCMLNVLTSPASSYFISEGGILDFYYRAIMYKRSLARKKQCCTSS